MQLKLTSHAPEPKDWHSWYSSATAINRSDVLRNGIRFGMGMKKQLAVRFPEELLVALDEAIGLGAAQNRSSAIVISMQEWLEREGRKRVGSQIVAEYVKHPQTAEETAWVRASSEASIAAEPW